ncbi:MAG: hypothetical protein H7039_10775 [Bryobacteraceae bacterium]|nr:hypothetical protein [Bryobacteraceae bacterium]
MFDSLDETMKQDELKQTSSTERIVRYIVIAAASVILFGGLILGVQMLS